MALGECVTKTPRLVFDKEARVIKLTDGEYQQVLARPEGMSLYILWKRTGEEIQVSLDHLVALIVQAGE